MVGVGQFVPAEHPDSVAPVGSTNGACRYNLPLTSVPKRGQVAKDSVVESSGLRSKQTCDVLKECEAGSYVAKYSPTLAPQVPFVCAGESLSGAGVRLTREAPADNIREYTASLNELITANILDSAKTDRIGKVLVIDGAGEGLDFGVGEPDKTALCGDGLKSALSLPDVLFALAVCHSVGNFCGDGKPSDS